VRAVLKGVRGRSACLRVSRRDDTSWW